MMTMDLSGMEGMEGMEGGLAGFMKELFKGEESGESIDPTFELVIQ